MPKKKSEEEVIAEFISIHGERYDYSKTIYLNSSVKVLVICKNHGAFEILSTHHKKGVGCGKCYFESQKTTIEEFLKKSRSLWGDTYDYSFVDTIPTIGQKVKIFCNLHNDVFMQEPRSHMAGHTGCVKCKASKLSGNRETIGLFKSQKELNESMILKASKIHGRRYDYSDFVYVKNSIKGKIICRIHGPFWQAPGNHFKGSGCPKCASENLKTDTFKEKCKLYNVNYHRALKRKKAGLSDEKIFNKNYIRSERAINEIVVNKVTYPNIEEAVRFLNPPASPTTISRWIKEGVNPEQAFERIPNPGYSNGIIYVITNIINQKKYVGLTVQTCERRLAHHIEQANRGLIIHSDSLHAAIREFGSENFSTEQIDVGTTKRNLEKREIEWISKLNTLIPYGYNISKGGASGGSNKRPTIVDEFRFASVKEASEYVAKSRNISLFAAERRLLAGRIDVPSPSKPGESYVKTKVYKAWSNIKNALNPRSKDYIPDITMYEPWLDFKKFRDDVGEQIDPNMTFTRLDKSNGFYPENCSWLTKSEASKINAEFMKKNGRLIGRKKV